ncbi:hypothetical protein SDC9_183877 [bioreactor metagenome]|uniref:Uncharacterized protein n=1 Tax=bioreactor metagenome TaxID=1076179 RepID=A0A645HBF9_9ZZZZ
MLDERRVEPAGQVGPLIGAPQLVLEGVGEGGQRARDALVQLDFRRREADDFAGQ